MNFEWSSFLFRIFVFVVVCTWCFMFLFWSNDSTLLFIVLNRRRRRRRNNLNGKFSPKSFTICVASLSICLPTNVSTIFRLFSSVFRWILMDWALALLNSFFSSLDRCVIEFFGWLHYFTPPHPSIHIRHMHTHKQNRAIDENSDHVKPVYSSKQRFFCLLLFLF